MTQNIYQEAKKRWTEMDLKFTEKYSSNGASIYEFEGQYEAICAINEITNYIDEWGLDGEYKISYLQRFAFEADENADEKGIYCYKILIEEL